MNSMSRKTVGLIIGLFIVTGILLYMAIAPTLKKDTPSSPQTIIPTPTSAAHSTLVFSPQEISVTAGVPTTATIDITTGENNVRAVQLELSYDPAVLSNVSVKKGTFFPNAAELIPASINTRTGRISYALGVTEPKKGTGSVATITFTPRFVAPTTSPTATEITTQIEFLDLSKVAASGIGPSVLKTSTNLTLTIRRSGTTTSVAPTTPAPTVAP